MKQPATILILGGGVGGLVAARTLRKALAPRHRIILVDRQREYLFAPSLLWLMTGHRRPEQIVRPLARLERKGIEVIEGTVRSIDPLGRRVEVDGASLAADYLVIALGAELAPEAVPGLAEAGHSFYTLEGAQSLERALAAFRSGRLVILTAAPAYKCPAAPYEAAMLLASELDSRGVRDRIQIDLYAAEPGPMGVAGPEVSAAVRRMVEDRGIAYHPGHQIASVDPAARLLRFADGTQADFDLLAYVPLHRAPHVVREAGLTDESGWIPVDRHTLETRFPSVYAVGDVTTIPLKLGKPLPKAGVFAHGEAEVVARNIARAISGKGRPAAFQGEGACFVEIGNGRAALGTGNFYAEPTPEVRMKAPGRRWHWSKVLFEKSWLWRWI
ncbi:MAG: NAD(P)/FAD-dependent oxidoreductase [Thermoanaerobaculia bacterium]